LSRSRPALTHPTKIRARHALAVFMKSVTVLCIAASLMCCAVAINQYDSYKSRHSHSQPVPTTSEPQRSPSPEPQHSPSVETLIGKPAPDFNLVSFDGSKTVRLSDYKGRPVILTFWATYCGWCRDEAPWFSEVQSKYANEGLQILSVVPLTDSRREEVAHALKTWGIKYPVLISDQSAEAAYYVNWFPTTIYIDPKGMVIKAEDVGVKGLQKLDENVQELLR
jgi:cytochrome c biogenesis protein CcmG, thiol:disulfide interchange protein DsbE